MPPETYDILLALLSGIDPKSLNTTQDMLSTVFDPQYGVSGSTFDTSYTLPAPYTPNTPRLDAYMNSSNPIFRDVASGIQTGALDEASAVAALYNGLGYTYDTEVKQGLSVGDLRSAVKEMFDEKERDVAARIKYDQDLLKSEQENVYGKAGLPQPYQDWTPDTMPISQDLRAFLSRLEPLQRDLEDKKRNVLAEEKLAKQRMLSKVTPSAGSVVNKDLKDEYAHWFTVQKRIDANPQLFPWDVQKLVERKLKEYDDKVASGVTYQDELKDDYSKWFKLQERIDKNPQLFSTDVVVLAKRKIDEYNKKLSNSQTSKTGQADLNEQKLYLNRAINQSAQKQRDESVAAQKRLEMNQAIANLRMAGEKIGLQMQGQTPLAEALRRRALGLGGM